jgi:periplasmic protein TonB
MFEQTFVDGVGKTNKTWTVMVSFVAQILLIVVAILVPLIYTDVLPSTTLSSFLVAPPPPPPPAVKKEAAPQRIKVGGNVQAAMVLKRVQPVYPQLAKSARVSGVVHLAAIIAKDGTIQELHSLGGPALLITAAMDAVKQWVYRPTLLNGEPVQVETTIDVNFTLNQ